MTDLSRLRVPYELRLGVTGHRNLTDPAAVEVAVEELLDHVERTLCHREQVLLEWTIVSPLAKGADRIVARAVLRRPNARLEVITPFGLDEYRLDFEEPSDLAEFDALLSRVQKEDMVVQLNQDLHPPRGSEERNRGYLDVGKAIIHACEIVIAIWDDEAAAGTGGTGDVVQYALDRGRVLLWVSAKNPASGARLLQPTRRAPFLGDRVETRPPRARPLPENLKEISTGYHQLACFLRDKTVPPASFREMLVSQTERLRKEAEAAELDESQLEALLRDVLPYYARAEVLATAYQNRHYRSSKAIPYLLALAVSIVVFQLSFFPHAHGIVVFEILAMLGALGCLAVNRRQAWHEKWLHDRYLCEHMRTAIYTLLLHDEEPAADSRVPEALPFYAEPKTWLPTAIRRIVQAARAAAPVRSAFEPVKRFLIDGLLLGQQQWHSQNAVTKRRLHLRSRWTVIGLFGATLVMATLHLADLAKPHGVPPIFTPGAWFTFLAISLPVWAAAVHALDKQFEFERVSARSTQMSRILERLIARAERAHTLDELRGVAGEAAFVIGLENYEWSVLLSFGSPELSG